VTAKEGSKMAFGVTDFTGVISSRGLASSNKFEVDVFFPQTGSKKEINLMCDTATIAVNNIQTTADIQYGIRREIAYGAPTYDPLTLTFYCTEELLEKRELDKWQQRMVKTSAIKGNNNGGTFDVGYYDDYAKDTKIVVTKLSVTGSTVYKHEYREAYPKTISAIELSHGTSSGPMKVSATFNYIYWKDVT
jgi:hypothetical protein